MGERGQRPDGRDPGWEEHRAERIVSGLHATPAQRVRWLEEVLAIAYRVGALPRRREE